MELSIIIPLYNAEKYLKSCLETLLNVSENLKIILVNDGSSDNTEKICKEYVDKYDNILYFVQENTGVSSARNNGLNHVTSKYVMFVDGDDCVDVNKLKLVIEKCSKQDFELCITDYCNFDDHGWKEEVNLKQYLANQKFVSLIETILTNGVLNTCWAKIYRTDIIKKNNLSFLTDVKIGEDVIFLLEYLKYINSYIYINEHFYYYRKNPQSAMNKKISFSRIYDLEKSYCKRIEIAKLYVQSDNSIFQSINCYYFQNMLYLIRNKLDDDECRSFIKNILDKDFFAEILDNMPINKLSKYEKIVFRILQKRKISLLLLCERMRKRIRKGR